MNRMFWGKTKAERWELQIGFDKFKESAHGRPSLATSQLSPERGEQAVPVLFINILYYIESLVPI